MTKSYLNKKGEKRLIQAFLSLFPSDIDFYECMRTTSDITNDFRLDIYAGRGADDVQTDRQEPPVRYLWVGELPSTPRPWHN